VHPNINFVITGMQAPRTGPNTIPNTTLTPTTKPIKARVQVTGPWWVLKPIPSSLLPMSPLVFPCRFSLFLFPCISYVCLSAEHHFPHIVHDAARVCISPDSRVRTGHPQIWLTYSPTPPKCSTRALLALINNLGIVYHQYCSS
jgi:hypothetical protein